MWEPGKDQVMFWYFTLCKATSWMHQRNVQKHYIAKCLNSSLSSQKFRHLYANEKFHPESCCLGRLSSPVTLSVTAWGYNDFHVGEQIS